MPVSLLRYLERWQTPMDGPVPVLPTRAIPFVLAVAWVFKGTLLVRMALEGCASVVTTYNPYFYKLVIDSIVDVPVASAIPPITQHYLILYIGIGLVLTLVLNHVSRLVDILNLQTSVAPLIRRWLYTIQLQQSLTVFQNTFAGSLASQVGEAARGAQSLLSSFSSTLIWSPLTIGAGLYLIWGANLMLALPLLVWTVLFIGLQFPQILRLDKLSETAAEIRSRVIGFMVDTFSNITTVKLFAQGAHERASIGRELAAERRNALALQWGYFKLYVTSDSLNMALDGATLVLALWLRYHRLISTGDIIMAMALVERLRNNVRHLANETSSIFESHGQLRQALGQLLMPITVADAPDAMPLQVPQGRLAFEDVSFRYNANTPLVMDKLSLTIPAGQKVGLVGPSGAGKSTLVNLLLRFYDTQAGMLTVDGQDIRQVTQDSLRGHIGMVTQDTSLLHRSIAENIAYGKPEADMEEIIAAARKAHAHDFIQGLADKDGNTGYATRVGERGIKLSGGQRQRIAIARLILKNAPILVLDEATSALDSEAEAAIQENLSLLMEGKTVIAIAHRLSTIAKLDRLIVLEDGRIVEDGSHHDLIRKNGLYARLWTYQSGGFLQDEPLIGAQGE